MPVGAIIGAGAGLASSLFGKKNQTQTQQGSTSYQIDPAYNQWLQQQRGIMGNLAMGNWQANPGLQQIMTQLMQQGGQGLNSGMGILTGQDPNALNVMIAPQQAALNTIYDQQQGQGLAAIQKQLQLAGGLGNVRSGIPIGDFMSGMGATRAQGLLGLYNQAFSNAGQAANLGMGALQGGAGIGQFLSQLPMMQAQARAGILGQSMQGPFNYTQGTTGQQTIPVNNNPFASMLGGASMGYGLFGGGGGPSTASVGSDAPAGFGQIIRNPNITYTGGNP